MGAHDDSASELTPAADDRIGRRDTEREPTDAALDLLDAAAGLAPEEATERDRAAAIVRRGLFGPDAEHPRIGRFVVLRRIGAGGMGVVYAAYDEELDRKVALKVIREGGRVHSERMRREAQVMAKLSHPNVVHVYDVGMHEGELFIAMEYVRGTTLGRWSEGRAWDEVLAVYRQAGEGLAAAHAAGLIHRDFKPDNALVGEDPHGAGRVRVVDFGLARSGVRIEPEAGETTQNAAPNDHLTRTGAILGTPAYMAPEQFLGATVGPRTDQFAFCIALWEALYGRRPFGEGRIDSLATAVIEGNLVAPPTDAKVPRFIHQALVKGLQTDPSARHASMRALLHALGDDPRRRRRIATAIGLLAVAGAAAFGARAWAEHRDDVARTERVAACEDAGAEIRHVWSDDARGALQTALSASGLPHAATAADKVVGWIDAHADAWQRARTDACLDADVHGTWDQDTLDRSLWCLDERRSELEALVVGLSRSDARGQLKAVQAAAALASVATCRDADVLSRRPAPPTEHREEVRAIRSELSRAAALRITGSYDEGLGVAASALERALASGWPPLTASAHLRTGLLLESKGDFAAAEHAFEEAYFQAAKAGATETAIDAANQLTFTVGLRLARPPEGLRWSRLAELSLASHPDPTGTRTADHLDKTASVHATAGDYATALELWTRAVKLQQRALGPEQPELCFKLGNMASAQLQAGAFADARATAERALQIAERAFGPEHPNVGTLVHNLANADLGLRDYEAARKHYERALAIREAALGPQHPDVAGTLNNLGQLAYETKDYAVARTFFERALAIAERAYGPKHPEVAGSLTNLGNVEESTGAYAQAKVAHERALAIFEATLGPEHPRVAMVLNNLANVLASLHEAERARTLYERSLAINEKVLGPDSPVLVETLRNFARLCRASGDPARADALEARAVTLESRAQ